MKMLVLGGTGLTGGHVARQAAAAGHDVTIFGRTMKAGVQVPGQFTPGDVTDRGTLTRAMRGHDIVISAIGRGLSFKSEHLIERSVPQILGAMADAGVRRLVFTSALGVGDTFSQSPPIAKLFFSTLLRGIYADKFAGDTMIRASDRDWTIVQPSQMTNGPLTKKYRSGEHVTMTGMPQISRADAADFILKCATDDSTIRKTLIASN